MKHKVKVPKEIGDVVVNCSLHPTSNSWSPSYDRGYESKPLEYEVCECWDCLLLPIAKRLEEAEWSWMEGGRVSSRLYTWDVPRYMTSKPKIGDVKYTARVTFWGLDDTGMEKFFEYEEDARKFICNLPSIIEMEWLQSIGFGWC